MPRQSPSAATVLPAPVACSNQKRRLAPGSSSTESDAASSSASSAGSQSSGSSSASSSPSSSTSPDGSSSEGTWPLPLPLPPLVRGTSSSAVSAISVPESASTWCADSTVPSTRCGSSSDSTRSRPRMSEKSRRHCTDGSVRPASSSASAASRAARRAVPAARAVPASSPSSTSGSRANSSARRRSSPDTGAVLTTEVLSATIGRSLQGERTAGLSPRRKRVPR